MASRLSENPGNRVLLIESGRKDRDPWIHIPATFFKVMEKGVDVKIYEGEPTQDFANRTNYIPQGHVIGGGSSVNAMVYIRGAAVDYDNWAQMGNRGWSYDDVLPVFRDLEHNPVIHDQYHGDSGELHVSRTRYQHPLSKAFVKACTEAGIPANDDFNGASQEGAGFYQTTTHNGRRWSSAQAFLRQAEGRQNLNIMTERRVARILFEANKAVGVEMETGERIACGGEIIMCAGAIETPRLMQISGIGNAEEISSHGIEVVHDLPGVGENFQDHLEVPVQGESKDPISLLGQDKGLKAMRHGLQYMLTRTGILSSNVVECGAFADLTGDGVVDVQFHTLPTLVGFVDREPYNGHGITMSPCNLRPKSRGSVKLRSSNPKDPALFDAGGYSDPWDVEIMVRAVQLGIKILEAPALASIMKRRVLPEEGIENDRSALEQHVRSTSKTVFHPSGTCKMSPDTDKMAVVGPDLKVHGVEGLRVADASVMPTLVSGNTNAPVMMIAERCARDIMGKHKLAG
jgi:choline dehydrogenase-like flavoprotein